MGNKGSSSKTPTSSRTPQSASKQADYFPKSQTPSAFPAAQQASTGNSSSATTTAQQNSVPDQLYETYRQAGHDVDPDSNEEFISGDGIMKLAEDLSIDPTNDPLMLVLLYKLQCKPQFRLFKSDFISVLQSYRFSQVEHIKDMLPKWKREIYGDQKEFKKFYAYCFKNNLEASQKVLVIEIAVPTWKLVLKEKCKFVDEWCEFVEQEYKKAISKDTWDILLDFINQVTDFDKYDDQAAWPTAIDEFVVWYKDKKKQKQQQQ